jgi:hypothetical protein
MAGKRGIAKRQTPWNYCSQHRSPFIVTRRSQPPAAWYVAGRPLLPSLLLPWSHDGTGPRNPRPGRIASVDGGWTEVGLCAEVHAQQITRRHQHECAAGPVW